MTKETENLKIDYTTDGDVLNCTIIGRIDANTSSVFQEIVDKWEFDSCVIEGKDLHYISSAGLRTLLVAVKKAKSGNLTIHHVTDTVKEILEVTGFDSIINVE